MRVLAIALLVCFACGTPVIAQPSEGAEQAEILWTGIFRARVIGTVEQPNTAIGVTNLFDNVERLEMTTTVPARLGVSFGLEYRLAGELSGGQALITVVVIPPKAGLLNPATQKRVYRETWRASPIAVGSSAIIGYRLEKDWEVLPGLWKFEIWHRERKLGEQTFCLVQEDRPGESSRKVQEEQCHSAATA
jgi:hypothetical protein